MLNFLRSRRRNASRYLSDAEKKLSSHVKSAQYLQGDSRNDTRNACEYWVFAVPYFGHDIMYPKVSGNPAPDGRRLDRADIILEVSRGPESEGMG